MYYKERLDNVRRSIKYHLDYIDFIKEQCDNNDEMAQEIKAQEIKAQEIIIARLKQKLNKLKIIAIQEDFKEHK